MPPDDPVPAPAIARYLRSRLPNNKHVFVWPRSQTTAPASATTMPGCDETGDHIGVVTLFGLMQTTGDAPSAYAKTLHDCLLHDRRAWVVDLRNNAGGNRYPMIGGLAALLPIGRLYAFADRHRVTSAEVGIDGFGVTIDHELPFAAGDAGSRTAPAVIVVFGKSCGSSCEQTAHALAARPRTLFVGKPSAGYLTANVPLPINDDYVLSLTTGYTQDPCGRIIESLSPDVTVENVADKSIDALLGVSSVSNWLAAQSRHGAATEADPPRRCG